MKKVILEKDPGFVLTERENRKQEINWLEYQPGKLKLLVKSDQPGFIFLANNFYPGWKAFVDGKETKIYRANYTFRAIAVPVGAHQVEFVYDPLSFKIGIIISFLTAGGLLRFGVISFLRLKS